MLPPPILVVAKLAGVFDALEIRYVVGGSVASSIYGIPRATQDVDLVADVRLSHVDAFTSALAGDFYVDADMIRNEDDPIAMADCLSREQTEAMASRLAGPFLGGRR
jgi:hypothetical protein